MTVDLSPTAVSVLQEELARLESERRAYEQRITEIRQLLNGSGAPVRPPAPPRHVSIRPSVMAAAKNKYSKMGFRDALRSVLAGRMDGLSPIGIFDALKAGGVEVPGGDSGLKNRVYVELGKLHRTGKVEKSTDSGAVEYRLVPPPPLLTIPEE
jgi:hypothetical protein